MITRKKDEKVKIKFVKNYLERKFVGREMVKKKGEQDGAKQSDEANPD